MGPTSIDEEVRWDFDHSLEGWGASTSGDMNMEVYPRGGELRGAIRGRSPHIDSPPLDIDCNDKHYIVFRSSYRGSATMGKVTVRSGGQLPGLQVLDDFQANWLPRRNVTLLSASSNKTAMSGAADRSLYSSWTSTGSTDQWLVLDVGAFLPVSRIEVDVTRDKHCPRNMRLQKSLGASGEFVNVATFAITNDSRLNTTDYTHVFEGFQDWSRFWRLYIDDNFGASNIRIREVRLLGPDEGFVDIPFDLWNDGRPRTYYLPLHDYFQGTLTQLRLHPAIETKAVTGITQGSPAPRFGESWSLDWLAVVKAPTITGVEGCIDKYHHDSNLGFGAYNLTAERSIINGYLPQYSTAYHPVSGVPYASTYNCYQQGGQLIRLSGLNLGESPTNVTVGGRPCTQVVVSSRQSSLTCLLPPGVGRDVDVSIANARYPSLWHAVPYLCYQVAPPTPLQPVISNIAACSVDLSWSPAGDVWDVVTVTGYVVHVREGTTGSASMPVGGREWDVVVGNVTFTTITGLRPDTQYDFAIASMAENQTDVEWKQLDLYGRRPMVRGALVSALSTPTNITATLPADFTFQAFDANSTLSHGASEAATRVGPTGVSGGEGHYGLVLMGDANLQGCNASFACCDGYNDTQGPSSCAGSYMCTAIGTEDFDYEDGFSSRPIDTNKDGGFKTIRRYAGEGASGSGGYAPVVPRLPCGPALTLTSSEARLTGSAWYGRQMEVREGFDTSFHFRVSGPSTRCGIMDDEYTHCRSRGGDGFAFVLQLESDMALGEGGMGLGYQEIDNSLAVEFDTYHNFELIEPYENHIAVNTRGWRQPNSANHSYSLASDVRIPDLADGRVHVARIRYEPSLDESHLLTGLFQASPHSGHFFVNADFPQGAMGDWGSGVGLLTVWVDDLFKPVLVTPLNLDSTLRLHRGRAWVGFTAATGDDTWQVHDILDWSFTSLRQDVSYYPPPVVNGIGAYQCANATLCVHP